MVFPSKHPSKARKKQQKKSTVLLSINSVFHHLGVSVVMWDPKVAIFRGTMPIIRKTWGGTLTDPIHDWSSKNPSCSTSPGITGGSGGIWQCQKSGWGWEISLMGESTKMLYFNWRKCWCYKVPIPMKLQDLTWFNQPKMEEVWGIDSATLERNVMPFDHSISGEPIIWWTKGNQVWFHHKKWIEMAYHQQKPWFDQKAGIFGTWRDGDWTQKMTRYDSWSQNLWE